MITERIYYDSITGLISYSEPCDSERDINFDTNDEYQIYIQNFRHYKINGNQLERFDSSEDLICKEKYLIMIRRHRARALKLYDIYALQVARGKIEENKEVEYWYKWALYLPANYNNNIPYYTQIIELPVVLKNFT